MRRKISFSVIFAIVLFAASPLFLCNSAFASQGEPSLIAIRFKNAEIEGEFREELHEYSLTLNDNTASPTLESYAIRGEANIFINYVYDETKHQIGLTATLQYPAGSKIYNFTYSNPATYVENGNNRLSSIYCFYGELSPALNDEDTDYKMYIPYDLTELKLTPVTSDINAYCAPVEFVLSAEQMPKIKLTCIASDGSKRDYTIHIKRVDKTMQQVEYEMQQPGYVSFVEGTRLFEKPEFIVTMSCVAGGIVIIFVLFMITRRFAVNPYDSEEKPFYSSVE